MAHLLDLRSDKRYMPIGNFYSCWASRKKAKKGCDLWTYFFKKNLQLLKTYFFKKPGVSRLVTLPFEITDKRKLHAVEILENCVTPPGNSTFFLGHPWILYMHILFLQYI